MNGIPPAFGVVFDMDGVLIDSAAPHRESWRLLAEESGGCLTDEQFRSTFGRHNRDIIPMLFGPVSEAQNRLMADRKEELYRAIIRGNPPLMDGAAGLIRELGIRGVRLAIGSSAPRKNIDLVLQVLGVNDRMSAIVSGDDVTKGKPDPEVFQKAADRLGLPPNRCVVIEDAPSGVEAARSAGARVVALLTYHPREALAGADLIVTRLGELTFDRLAALVG